MTFSARAKVQDVSEQNGPDDQAPVDVLCQIEAPTDGGPIVGGELRLQIKPGVGLQLPNVGDRVSLSGWFSYDDGSRSTATPADSGQ